jgi:hypothetical protein
MSDKWKQIQAALLKGASAGLSEVALYDFVTERCPAASQEKIVRNALALITNPEIDDRRVLDALYALVIVYRLAHPQNV